MFRIKSLKEVNIDHLQFLIRLSQEDGWELDGAVVFSNGYYRVVVRKMI